MKRIFITDDHSLVREGFVKLLELSNDLVVVGTAGTGQECIDRMSEVKPDILLLDISLPDMNGLEVLRVVKEQHPDIKVIMLTVHDDYAFVMDSLNSGASGYMLKVTTADNLVHAIEAVSRGERYVEPSISGYLKSKGKDGSKNDVALTRRENQVLGLIAAGYSNKGIAESLGVSEKTVKNHLSSLFKKINVADRTNAAIYALKNNIIHLE